jgi:hypothetical protein
MSLKSGLGRVGVSALLVGVLVSGSTALARQGPEDDSSAGQREAVPMEAQDPHVAFGPF